MTKMFITTILVGGSITTATADGTVQFLNSALSKVKYQETAVGPIVDAPIGTRIGIFWGTDPTNLSLVLPTTTIAVDGIFNGGFVYPIPGTQPQQTIYVKVAGWNGAVGDHWSNSVAYGESEVVRTAELGLPAGPATPIWQSASGTSTNRVKPFTILSVGQSGSQTIDFPPLSERTFGDTPFLLTAVASSGLPVTFSSSDQSVAQIDGSVLTIVGAGSAIIGAFQAGTSNIRPASASRTLTVRKAIGLVSIVDTVRRYDGMTWNPSVVTDPPGLPVVMSVARNGLAIPLTSVGQYEFTAYIASPNYAGGTNGVLTILPGLFAETPGGGAVTIDPTAGAYHEDGTALVTASPEPGWTFLQWLGSATGSPPVLSMTMNRTHCLQAIFGTSLGEDIEGGGQIVRNPVGPLYPFGEIVRLTAVPPAGSYFDRWSDPSAGTSNPLSFPIVTAAPRVTAVFAPLPAGSHAITVIPDGFGQVDRHPPGNLVPAGTEVVVTARPAEGQQFIGWSGDANGSGNPLVVTVTQSRTITARFSKRPRLSTLVCNSAAVDDLQILVTGEFGGRYVIESQPLAGGAAWEPIGILETPFGAAEHLESISRQTALRVYRAVRE